MDKSKSSKTITFFYRNKNCGFSIEKVFTTIQKEIERTNVTYQYFVPSNRALPMSIIKNLYYIFKHRDKNGINHITGDIHYGILGLIGCYSVLTIHDLVVIDNASNPLKKLLKWFFWIYLPVLFANEVVCISNKTKDNLTKYVHRKKINVIHNPIDPIFNKKIKSISDIPIILHIGCGWNKNLVNVIKAIEEFNIKLRIIGKLTKDQLHILQERNINYSYSSNLTDEDILLEYERCDIISFPSLYEGFGMPVIEGQSVGRVILTSNIEPLVEIGGKGAYYVNPYSIDSIRDGFKKLLSDKDLRDDLIQKGFNNIKRFNVSSIAMLYCKLYDNILLK